MGATRAMIFTQEVNDVNIFYAVRSGSGGLQSQLSLLVNSNEGFHLLNL